VTVNSHTVDETFIFLAFSGEVPLACGHILNSVQWITTVTYIAHSTLEFSAKYSRNSSWVLQG